MDDDKVDYKWFDLIGSTDARAQIRKVHIWHGGIGYGQRIYQNDGIHISGRNFREHYDVPNKRCIYPITMSIEVFFWKFATPGLPNPDNGGEVIFVGAGGAFDERS